MAEHAILSPSSAERWFECPGSITASIGMPNHSSAYAREGTAAHELAEMANREGKDPAEWKGHKIAVPYTDDYGVKQTEAYTVDLEMVRYVRSFVSYCTGLKNLPGTSFHAAETVVSLAALGNSLEKCWGTADFIAYDADNRRLHVVDLKYGKGVEVHAAGNLQLLIYALAAWVSLGDAQGPDSGKSFAVDEVAATIIQPRIGSIDPDIRVYTAIELLDFLYDIQRAAVAALDEKAPRHAGEQCRFCPARFTCPEYAAAAQGGHQLSAQDEFNMTETNEMTALNTPNDISKPPSELSVAEVAEKLQQAQLLQKWIKDATTYLYEQASQGVDVPGFKVVDKRPSRVWAQSEAKTYKALKSHVSKKSDVHTTKLLSPAQVEKVIGKANLDPELVQSISSGTTLVPESDPRQPVGVSAQAEFDDQPKLEDLL